MSPPDPGPRGTAAAYAASHPLLQAPILPTLVRLARPALLLVIFQIGVSVADTFYIGRLGTQALAGFSLVFPLVQLMQMLSGGALGGGVSSAVARALGAGDKAAARSVVIHSVMIAIGMGLAYMAMMLVLGESIFRLLGGANEPLAIALAYSDLLFLGAVFTWLSSAFGSLIRGTGNTRLPALVQLSAHLLHIPLSGALVLGWAGLPALGIRGAAIAYVVSAFTSSLLGALVVLRRGSPLRPERVDLRLHREGFARILRVGVLSAVSALQSMLGALLLTGFVGAHGTAALAGYGVSVRLELLMMSVVFAVGQVLVPMVGTAVGAGDEARAKRAAFIGAGIAASLCLVVGLVAALWPSLWVGIFSADPAVLAAGGLYLHIVGPAYVLQGLGSTLYFASQGAGKVLAPVLAATARLALIFAGGSLLVAMNAPLWGVFALASAGMSLYGILTTWSVHRQRWQR